MEEICGGTKPYLGEGHLEAEHLRIRDKAIFQVINLAAHFHSVDATTTKIYKFFLSNEYIVHI